MLRFTTKASFPEEDGADAPFEFVCLDPNSPVETVEAARSLLLEYGRFVASQSGAAGFCLGALEQEARDLPDSYLSQHGGVVLARRHPPDSLNRQSLSWLGSIAWRALPSPELSNAREIKRLWVRPEARGLRLGRALVQAVIDRVRSEGIRALFLDTVPSAMDCAHRLYESMGFERVPSYNGRAREGIVYMRKLL